MKTYDIEIIGLATIEANSKKEAIELVKEQFEDGNLSWEDLHFSCDDDE